MREQLGAPYVSGRQMADHMAADGSWGAYIDATADETAAPRGEMPFSFYARFDSALFFHSMPTNPMCCTTSLGGDLAGAFRGASCHQAGAVVSTPFGSI